MTFRFAPLLMLLACSTEIPVDLTTVESELTVPEAHVHFRSDWNVAQTRPLIAGGTVRFEYADSRLPQCRGDANGKPAWSITGYYRLNSGPVGSFEAGGLSPSQGTVPPVAALAEAGDLAVWFQISNRWGCTAWDSKFGQNYHFTVLPQPLVHFKADGTTQTEGLPGSTDTLTLDYDLNRLPTCRQTYNGLPAWDIEVLYRFDGGAVNTQPVTQRSGNAREAVPVSLSVPTGSGEVELWFRNTDRTGCAAYDSQQGRNYRFRLR